MKNHGIVRCFSISGKERTIKKGLTFGEAKTHIKNPESTSSFCKGKAGILRTKNLGAWYDIIVLIKEEV